MKRNLIFTILIHLLTIACVSGSNHPLIKLDSTLFLDIENENVKLTGESKLKQAEQTFSFEKADAILNPSLSSFTADDNMEDIYRKEVEYYGNPKVIEAKKFIEALQGERLIDVFTGSELVKLPVGIKKTINGYTYSIVFAEAMIYPDYASLKVYGGIQKEGEADLFFGADNVKFSSEGGIIGDAQLALFGDYPLKRESRKMAFLFKGFENDQGGNHRGCYISFDCNGFVEARIEGDVILSREWVLPTDTNGKVKGGNDRVSAQLSLVAADFSDFVAEASFPYFTLAQDTSLAFFVNRAVIDFSDIKNAPGFFPPPEFDASGEMIGDSLTGNYGELWKGIYFEKLEILLPDVFKQENESLAFGAERLYIDSKGVSGILFAENILPEEKGKLGNTGWKFGIERVDVHLMYNQIYRFGFAGRISIPISKQDNTLAYAAYADLKTATYNFNFGLDSLLEVPMWGVSEMKLHRGSKLNIAVSQGQFKAQAVLGGSMNINMRASEENKGTELHIADIAFDKLLINDEAPYVMLSEQGGHITFTSGPVLNNSILTIDHATLKVYDQERIMFSMGMEAGVMSESDGGAKTGGTFGMIGKRNMVNGSPEWVFDEMKLIALEIHLDFATAGYIKGGITFFSDDPIYGNGFFGSLEGGLLKTGNNYKFGLVANARFGTMLPGSDETYKYWSVDAYVSFSASPITIYPPIAANGFGGGIYHHMKMSGYNLDAMASAGSANPYSGLIYEPNPEVSLGLKATVGLTTTSGKAFQGVVTLELVFTDKLALSEILMYGTGEIAGSNSAEWDKKSVDNIVDNVQPRDVAMIANEEKAKTGKTNTITCAAFMRISLKDGFEMHGSFKAYLDAAEGLVTGEGMIDFLASERTGKWHMYVGGYTDLSITNLEGVVIPPINVGLNFSSFTIGANLYLLFGNDLPGPPPVKAQVASFFDIPVSSNNRSGMDEGGRSAGSGTAAAFGAGAYLDFTYKESGSKYLEVQGGAGFDISLLSNSDLSFCSLSKTSPQGQKGWRALGQLYVYASVEGRWKGDCSLCPAVRIPKQYIGLLVNGDLPNPDFFDVRLKVQIYSWLNVDRQIAIGEQCGEVLN